MTYRAYNIDQIPFITFDKGYRPETSFIFILIGTGIVVVFIDIYPILPYTPAFSHSFLLLVTVVKDMGSKHLLYFYSLVLELLLCSSISIR